MPDGRQRIQNAGHLHCLTFSCYRREAKLSSERDRDIFCKTLEAMRVRWDFRVVGYVMMPEHVHLLMSEPAQATLAVAMQMLKQTVSRRVGSVGPFWMSRYYDFNVWSSEKVNEKLEYIHSNPVRRGLVHEEIDWTWSSARFYAGLGVDPVVVERSVDLVLPGSVVVP